jgi:hypothetical protein
MADAQQFDKLAVTVAVRGGLHSMANFGGARLNNIIAALIRFY